jgi:macrolide-specific efflux system membrane fusion protein
MRILTLAILALSALSILPSPAVAQELRIPALIKLIDEADVPALEAGVLSNLAAQEGAKVEAGQILVQLVDREARLLCDRQRAEYEVARKQADNRTKILAAEAALKVAESELRRANEAIARIPNSVSQAELDRLELAVTQARLAIEQARHDVEVAALEAALKQSELAIAERKLERHTILAPFSGVVAQVFNRRGEWVEPGEKVLRLVRTDRLKAEGFIPSDKMKGVAVGSRVSLVVAGGSESSALAGAIVFVSPETDPFNGQIRIVAEIENAKGQLRPGVKGTLTIK